MGIMATIGSVFTGGGLKTIEKIATEWIETDMEEAQAKTLMIKTLDPNGLMRRNLSDRVGSLYAVYIFTMLLMLAIEFGCGIAGVDVTQVADTTSKVSELFVPITTLFGVIVSASFGVNYANTIKDK